MFLLRLFDIKSQNDEDIHYGVYPRKEVNMLPVPYNIIRNDDLSDLDVTVWCFTKILSYNHNIESLLVSVADLVYQMYGRLTVNHGITDGVGTSLRKLIKKEYIIATQVNNHSYAVNKDQYQQTNSEYEIYVDPADLRRIMQLPNHPAAVLRQYLFILSTINTKTKCSMWSIPQLAEDLDKGEKTIMKQNGELEELKLLYIYHAGNGRTTNTYGRYEDREAIERYGDFRTGGSKRKTTANYKRRMKQLANQVAKGKQYDQNIMEELAEYVNG